MDVVSPFHSSVLILCFVLFLPSAKPVSDYSRLLYKSCSSQTLAQTQTQILSSLFQQFIAQSSESKFFKTVEMGSDETAISGLFQCREDISREECFNCVNLLSEMSSNLCSDSVAGRVQLEKCYTQYETDGFSYDSIGEYKRNLPHRECGEHVIVNAKFRELMEAAFAAMQTEILDTKVGFYARNYESVMLMAQCEADLDACACSECVSDAIQVAREECGTSLSAHIYLEKCFMTYMYNPDATAGNGNSFPGINRNNSNNKRTAAIIVGGAAALSFGFIVLLFLKSRCRNKDYD